MKLKTYHYFYLFVAFLFLGIVSVELFSDGMFMDGLLYADISRNMAKGLGSFWKPHLTHTLYPAFYEHPPLAFGIQSLCFNFFGDSIYVERFYSLFTFSIVGYLIVLIWDKFTQDQNTGWVPLFFWVITSGIAWAAANNMLENTMSIFVCLSFLFYLNSIQSKRFLWVILAGLTLSLGVLTKGFFCLYLWGAPLFFWLFKQKRPFFQMIIDTVIVISFTTFPILLLWFVSSDAQHNMLSYFNKQVIGSIENVRTVDTRLAILGGFLNSIAAPLIIALIAVLTVLRQKGYRFLFKLNIREFLMFTVISLSGVIPIMISLKQRNFYILTVYPFFALGLAYYLYPILKLGINKITIESKGFKVFKVITFCIILISTSLSIGQINRVGRDNLLIIDCKAVIRATGKDMTINICSDMYSNWSLHGYFARYGNVSLDDNQENVCRYYLSKEDCNKETLSINYDLIPVETKKYKLYRLKK